MIFRSLLIIFFNSIFLLTSYSQQVLVVEKESKEPIEGVTLMSQEPKAFAVTNLYGKADLSDFKGSKEIQINHLGFEAQVYSYEELKNISFTIQLNSLQLQLDEVVISASRWRQNSSSLPNTISTIKPKDLSLQNPQTAADMLGTSGKVFIQKSQQGGGSPMIRGFATNRLLYSIDGVRMNTAIFRSGNIQNVINIDPYTVEETEILFGPASVSYGSDAIGGVMSFHSYGPQFSLTDQLLIKGSASSRVSSANNEITGHFDVNIGLKKWAFYTSFTNWNYDDLRQGSKGPKEYIKPQYVERVNGEDIVKEQSEKLLQIPSAYSQTNLMQKVKFKATEKIELNYSFNYSETSSYGRYDRHNREKNGNPRYAEWNYGPQKWMMNLFSLKHQDKTSLYEELTLRLAYQNFQESRISRNFNDPLRETREEEVDAFSINLDLRKKVGSRHTLFYGAEWVFNDVNSKGINENIDNKIKTKGPSRYPNSEWMSTAIFINEEYKITEKVNLLSGLRYSHYSLKADFSENLEFYPFPFKQANLNNDAITGSIGAVYRPNNKWAFRTNLGTAFRAPNVDDIGKVFDSEPGAVVIPNPDLEAEYAYNLDLGMTKVFHDFLKIDLTAFYTLLENAMLRRDYTLNGSDSILYDGELSKVQAIQNAAKANVYGLQFGLELKFLKYMSFKTDLNYQVGEEETDDGELGPSRHAAPFYGVSRLTFEKKRTRVQFYIEFQDGFTHNELAISERSKTEIYALDENGDTYSPEWYTLNLKIQQGFKDNFSIAAGIENITDIRYRSYSSGISAAGRNFYVSFTAKM